MANKNALLLWERLLPTPDSEDVADALRCEVRDPLWLLARQWQLGEFQAEDAGMAANAHVIARTTSPQLFSANGLSAASLTVDKPLDTIVESILPEFDLEMRMETGRKWRQMLFEANKQKLWIQFRQMPLLQFKMPAVVFDPDHPELRAMYHEPYEQLLSALGNARMIDGQKFFKELQTRNASDFLSTNDPIVDSIGVQWKNWVTDRLRVNNPDFLSSWNESRMEYVTKIAAPVSNKELAYLDAPEYNGQQMGWYDWENGKERVDLNQELDPQRIQIHRKTAIPTSVSFPGMPNARWWEMEDSTIDLSNIKAQKTDTGLLLLAEFSLLFSNDWLMMPLSLPLGSLSKIQSLRVIDVFGVQTFMKQNPSRADWRLFQLSQTQLADWMWLPPTSFGRVQSEALEEIKFIRDEMANMVWAVEQTVSDGIGGSVEGSSSAKGLEGWLRSLAGTPVAASLPELSVPADYAYLIGNTVPPHWIPFIPFRPVENKPEMALRRAAMPRIFEGVEEATRIRPRTSIIRNNNPMGESRKLDIQEEEIPATGITLKTYWRRARWVDGSIVTWLAREKRLGKSSESSGLQFDVMGDIRPSL
ncbi:hypothetical protein SYJ56_18915 [Algoriphagus sp. D3-2-R+10]|uniref:hypothetical protein n=1 Tax=Algoriphagus aurantiacus TaxID=3103948 RepID=UPI002B38E710|nr:hypothetical protein [Algoriphagus sp. D3-2-R+10]MEB2777393.1 hypothetical protein [Algoriphagus sp. D3-2-R+10]